MNKEELNCYYQSNIKTSRNEDSVYAIKYASQQMLIDRLEHNWIELKKWLRNYSQILAYEPDSYEDTMRDLLFEIIDKMTELERGE